MEQEVMSLVLMKMDIHMLISPGGGKTVEILVTVDTWEVKLGNGDILLLETVPLKLAWALTIHKSQGMTLSSVCITADMSIFEKGQFYVALSRLQSFRWIVFNKIYSDFNSNRFQSSRILSFS